MFCKSNLIETFKRDRSDNYQRELLVFWFFLHFSNTSFTTYHKWFGSVQLRLPKPIPFHDFHDDHTMEIEILAWIIFVSSHLSSNDLKMNVLEIKIYLIQMAEP